MDSVLIVAAEASSSLFAQRLLEHWKSEKRQIQAFGVGSQSMEDLGFDRLGKSEEMAVVGLAEIAEHFGKLRAVFHSLVAEAKRRKPQVAVIMDYPDFNLMLAKKLKQMGIPVVYYITPQVWAWRKGRVQTIKKYCDKVFVLFPFEVAYFREKGVACEFVGHPLLDELDPKFWDEKHRINHRRSCGIRDEEVVIGLMPGSRRIEMRQHLDLQMEVARKLYKSYPNIRILLMCAPTVDKEKLQEKLSDIRFPYMLLKSDPFEMIHLADYLLVASGTATLQVGLLEKPMVVMYKFKWLTGVIAKMIVRGVRFFGIVNLILGREVVPERWQAGANVEELFSLMKKYLDDPAYAQQVKNELKTLRLQLGEKGATKRVAEGLRPYFSGSGAAR